MKTPFANLPAAFGLALLAPFPGGSASLEATLPSDMKFASRLDPAPESNLPLIPFADPRPGSAEATMLEIFSLRDLDVAAKGWALAQRDGLRFRVEVESPRQENPFHERNLWRGDCIYLGYDGLGDSAGPGAAAPAEDDGVAIFGLGARGAEGRLLTSGDWRLVNAVLPGDRLSILRDETAHLTRYEMVLPWSWLHTEPGLSPTIALGATIAHKNCEQRDQTWGKINTAAGKPKSLHLFRIAPPPGPGAALASLHLDLAGPGEEAVISLAARTTVGARCEAELGDRRVTMEIPSQPSAFFGSLRIPGDLVKPGHNQVTIRLTGDFPARQQTFELVNPATVWEKLRERIGRLSNGANHPLVTAHLTATLELAGDAFRRLPWEITRDPARAREFVMAVERITALLPVDRLDFREAVNRGQPWTMLFISEEDRTWQAASLQLPFGWSEKERYPLVVYLHGSGTDNPVQWLTTIFDNSGQDTLFRNQPIDPVAVPSIHRAFVLAPWARGNSMYRGPAQADVLQAIDEVQRNWKIDPDRIYISGFSMGCSGAFEIATRYPDRFAGALLAAGFGEWSATARRDWRDNLRTMPLVVWCGELDSMHDNARQFAAQAQTDGFRIQSRFVPNTPHTYPYDEYNWGVAQLLTAYRTVPQDFTYRCLDRQLPGCRGLTMRLPAHWNEAECPRFRVRIEGATISIESAYTTGLTLDPVPLGLDRLESLTLLWNGQQVYQGPPCEIKIGEGARPPRN